MQYLGHLTSGEAILILKEKVEMILDLVPLRDVSETRYIIGLASYFRKFVANFSCQQSLDTIRAALTNSQILIF